MEETEKKFIGIMIDIVSRKITNIYWWFQVIDQQNTYKMLYELLCLAKDH